HQDDFVDYRVNGKVLLVIKMPDDLDVARNASMRDILDDLGPQSKEDYDYYENVGRRISRLSTEEFTGSTVIPHLDTNFRVKDPECLFSQINRGINQAWSPSCSPYPLPLAKGKPLFKMS
ncbi:MAG: hypothetical protein U1C97_03160, partial [Candidatus Gracilibacteria bacterium]|nr:hypothetical protein [Candidatus Gracilibacteria bacterium]